ncbi:hypothetical protein EDB81DRAFT_226028 [Dactylonectria macrodidyma]|uniref:Fungal N-terminal domain-containing protein n=1 Tax=Dactylonectria macrodidyma TaxID=307937 RepID=A0A9P9II89_9HYPO|nr:hypothetical protein EDB81DRAFT_226028 [Dactylonectria macrodidyma]
MDPLSITTGVLSLLGVCWTVGTGLKTLYDDIGSVGVTVAGIASDVDALTRVLTTMRATFDNVSRPTTGHVGTHWDNIDCSLKDGKKALEGLRDVVQEAIRDTSVLSGTRKHMRLKSAELKIGLFREQIRSFRETLQLSMQALILWNQTSLQDANDRIIPSLDGMQHEICQLGLRLNEHIILLQTKPIDAGLEDEISRPTEIRAITNMRNCMHSAATVVSSATTILGGELDDETASFCGSDWGDIFPSQTSEPTIAWLSSSALTSERPNSEFALQRAETLDSEPDLDLDLALGLYKKAQAKFQSDDYEGAEPLLRNCLSRLPFTSDQGQKRPQNPDVLSAGEVLGLLCKTCVGRGKWGEAASAMEDKMALEPHRPDGIDEAALEDLSTLVMILYSKQDYVKGFIYDRKLLRGYRKLGAGYEEGVERSLTQLVEICKASGNANEEDAYSIMLEAIREKKAAMAADAPIPEEICNNDGPVAVPRESSDLAELPTETETLTPSPGGSLATWMPASYWFPGLTETVTTEGSIENQVQPALTNHAPGIAPHSSQDITLPQANPIALASHPLALVTTPQSEPSAEDLLLQSGYFRDGMPRNSKSLIRRQLVMVGDPECGKSLMIHQHVHGFQHDTV